MPGAAVGAAEPDGGDRGGGGAGGRRDRPRGRGGRAGPGELRPEARTSSSPRPTPPRPRRRMRPWRPWPRRPGEEGDGGGAGTERSGTGAVGGVAQRAEAVLGFLKDDVLAAARPEGQEGGLGVDVTVRKAVDAAEPKIAEAFKDQPIVEADVRDTLGMTYCYLGEAPLAIRQFERALELRRGEARPRPPRHARQPQQPRQRLPRRRPHRRGHQDARGDAQAAGVEARPRPPRHAHQPQ